MYTHTPFAQPRSWQNPRVDSSTAYSALYFSYSSNLSPQTMRGRYPSSLFCGLAKLRGWRWTINGSSRYANIVPDPPPTTSSSSESEMKKKVDEEKLEEDEEDEEERKEEQQVVYGALYFITPRDEALLDEEEGVPAFNAKVWREVSRVGTDGAETGQTVRALMYVDEQQQQQQQQQRAVEEKSGSVISPDYVVWIRKAVRDAAPFGLPEEYVRECIAPWLPELREGEGEGDMQPVRMAFPQSAFQ